MPNVAPHLVHEVHTYAPEGPGGAHVHALHNPDTGLVFLVAEASRPWKVYGVIVLTYLFLVAVLALSIVLFNRPKHLGSSTMA
jgi:hypothetical protein